MYIVYVYIIELSRQSRLYWIATGKEKGDRGSRLKEADHLKRCGQESTWSVKFWSISFSCLNTWMQNMKASVLSWFLFCAVNDHDCNGCMSLHCFLEKHGFQASCIGVLQQNAGCKLWPLRVLEVLAEKCCQELQPVIKPSPRTSCSSHLSLHQNQNGCPPGPTGQMGISWLTTSDIFQSPYSSSMNHLAPCSLQGSLTSSLLHCFQGSPQANSVHFVILGCGTLENQKLWENWFLIGCQCGGSNVGNTNVTKGVSWILVTKISLGFASLFFQVH